MRRRVWLLHLVGVWIEVWTPALAAGQRAFAPAVFAYARRPRWARR